jgi:hypothetical protein
MGLFNRAGKQAKKVAIPPKSSALGLFHMEWERQRMPSPGAMNYSWQTLGLVPTSPISGAVAAREQFHHTGIAPQPVIGKAVPLAGTPIVSGQVMSAPLFNPDTGTFHSSPAGFVGAAYERSPEILPAGANVM